MYTPLGQALPIGDDIPLAASQTITKGGYVMVSPTTGYGAPGSASVSGQIPTGICNPSESVTSTATAGATYLAVDTRPFWGNPASTITNDGFAVTDVCTPFYVAGANTPGKLGFSTTKRSLGGLVLGLDSLGTSTPVQWCSPIAYAIAQSSILSNAISFGGDVFALTANTDRAEASMPRRNAVPGTVTSVRVKTDAGFTSSDTEYWTFTVYKRTAAAPGTAVAIATATLKTTSGGGLGTLTAWKYYDLTLSATATDLDLLAGDSLSVFCDATATAAAITRLTVEVLGKVG